MPRFAEDDFGLSRCLIIHNLWTLLGGLVFSDTNPGLERVERIGLFDRMLQNHPKSNFNDDDRFLITPHYSFSRLLLGCAGTGILSHKKSPYHGCKKRAISLGTGDSIMDEAHLKMGGLII